MYKERERFRPLKWQVRIKAEKRRRDDVSSEKADLVSTGEEELANGATREKYQNPFNGKIKEWS